MVTTAALVGVSPPLCSPPAPCCPVSRDRAGVVRACEFAPFRAGAWYQSLRAPNNERFVSGGQVDDTPEVSAHVVQQVRFGVEVGRVLLEAEMQAGVRVGGVR